MTGQAGRTDPLADLLAGLLGAGDAVAAHVASVLRAAGYTNGQATREQVAAEIEADRDRMVGKAMLTKGGTYGMTRAARVVREGQDVLALHPDPTPDATTDPRATLAALAATLTARTDERDQARAECDRLRTEIRNEVDRLHPASATSVRLRALLADDLRTQHPETADYADQPGPKPLPVADHKWRAVAEEPCRYGCGLPPIAHPGHPLHLGYVRRPRVADVTFDKPITVAGRPAGERKGGETP